MQCNLAKEVLLFLFEFLLHLIPCTLHLTPKTLNPKTLQVNAPDLQQLLPLVEGIWSRWWDRGSPGTNCCHHFGEMEPQSRCKKRCLFFSRSVGSLLPKSLHISLYETEFDIWPSFYIIYLILSCPFIGPKGFCTHPNCFGKVWNRFSI